MIEIPLEIVNHIFRYSQGSTNKIMKEHINNINMLKLYCKLRNKIFNIYLIVDSLIQDIIKQAQGILNKGY